MIVPARYGHVLFGFILSGLMSFIVSGIATARALGLSEGFMFDWITAWLTSWAVAFPTVLFVAPIARAAVARLVIPARD